MEYFVKIKLFHFKINLIIQLNDSIIDSYIINNTVRKKIFSWNSSGVSHNTLMQYSSKIFLNLEWNDLNKYPVGIFQLFF